MLDPKPGQLVMTLYTGLVGVFIKKVGNPIFEDGDCVVEVLPAGQAYTEKCMLSNLKEIENERKN